MTPEEVVAALHGATHCYMPALPPADRYYGLWTGKQTHLRNGELYASEFLVVCIAGRVGLRTGVGLLMTLTPTDNVEPLPVPEA